MFKKKHKWMLWSMDIYPDAFEAAGLIGKTHVLFTYLQARLKKYQPQAIIALGPVQKEYLRNKYYADRIFFELPCGIFAQQPAAAIPEWYENGKIHLGYCGNIGEAHSEEFLKAIIQNLDPAKFVMVMALYGSKAPQILNMAQGLPGVKIVPSVAREQLSFIDVHMSTLHSKWVNICVPSKTVSSVCAGAAFLYHGIEDSDNWVLLKNAGWRIDPHNNSEQAVQSFLQTITPEQIALKRADALETGNALRNNAVRAFQSIYSTIINN